MRTAAAVALVLGLVGEPGALPGATYFVNHQHPEAADTNAGTAGAPFRTIQAAADKVQPGDTILVRGGTYRETIVWQTPGRSDARITLSAATGETVVVKGSLVVTGWDRVAAKEAGLGDWPWANLWAKRDWKLKHILPPHAPASRAPNWLCWTDHPRQAFWKDAALEGAGRLAPAFFRWELEEGRIFHDRQAEVLYVWLPAGVDPNKDGIEVCVRPLLLTQVPRADRRCPFDCVTIRGLQFRHATPRSLTNWSAGGISGTGGVFEDCLVSWNDYVGWSVGGTSNTVRRCIFAYNGMAGLGGCGEGHLIEDNLVVANNIDNYVYFNSSGGGKLTNLRHTTFRRHKARFNNGCGLWLDIECNDNIFESCEFSHNGGAGLDIEISRRNLVRNCIFAFNTMRPSGYAIGHAGKEENQRVYDAGGGGWGLSNRGSEGTRVLNCLFYGNAEGGLMLGGGGRTWTENDPGTGSNVVHETVGRDLVAVNNILAHNGRWQLAFVNPNKQKEATGCRSDHNLFWGPNPVDGYGGLADWTRQTGFDAHSIEAMPDVPLAFAGFFAPAATAPEVDAGTLAPECPVDWHGLARPVGRAPDIGPFETGSTLGAAHRPVVPDGLRFTPVDLTRLVRMDYKTNLPSFVALSEWPGFGAEKDTNRTLQAFAQTLPKGADGQPVAGSVTLGGVPFHIAWPTPVLAFAPSRQGWVAVPLSNTVDWVFFLHAAAGMRRDTPGAYYRICYADKDSMNLVFVGEKNICDFASTNPASFFDRERGTTSVVAWEGKAAVLPRVSMIRMAFFNPRPDVPITDIQIWRMPYSGDWAVLGITTGKQ